MYIYIYIYIIVIIDIARILEYINETSVKESFYKGQ